MHYPFLAGCLAALFLFQFKPVLAVDTWRVSAFKGLQCTGLGVGGATGPRNPQSGTVCKNIPYPGYTNSLTFASNTGCSYAMNLFYNLDCKGEALGKYSGNPGGSECIEKGQAKSYSITTSCGGRSRGLIAADRRSTDISQIAELSIKVNFPKSIDFSRSGVLPLTERALYTLSWTQFAVASTATWTYNAAGKCPVSAKEEDVNKAQCGLSATFAVLSAFFAGFQLQGLYRHGAPDVRMKRGTFNELTNLLNLPQANDTIIAGLRITMNVTQYHIDHNGSLWHQFIWQGVDTEDGSMLNAILRLHPDGRSQAMSAVTDQSGKRTNVAAYYSWTANNRDNYKAVNRAKYGIKQAAASVWNYGKQRNVAEHCVNFADYETDPIQYIDSGSYALVSGTFVDQSGYC